MQSFLCRVRVCAGSEYVLGGGVVLQDCCLGVDTCACRSVRGCHQAEGFSAACSQQWDLRAAQEHMTGCLLLLLCSLGAPLPRPPPPFVLGVFSQLGSPVVTGGDAQDPLLLRCSRWPGQCLPPGLLLLQTQSLASWIISNNPDKSKCRLSKPHTHVLALFLVS